MGKFLLPQQENSRHACFLRCTLQTQEEKCALDTHRTDYFSLFLMAVTKYRTFLPMETDEAKEKGIKLLMIKPVCDQFPIYLRNTSKDTAEKQQAAVMSLSRKRKKETASSVKVLLF